MFLSSFLFFPFLFFLCHCQVFQNKFLAPLYSSNESFFSCSMACCIYNQNNRRVCGGPKTKGMINEVCYLAHSGFLTPHLLVQAVILAKGRSREGDSEEDDEELQVNCVGRRTYSPVCSTFFVMKLRASSNVSSAWNPNPTFTKMKLVSALHTKIRSSGKGKRRKLESEFFTLWPCHRCSSRDPPWS